MLTYYLDRPGSQPGSCCPGYKIHLAQNIAQCYKLVLLSAMSKRQKHVHAVPGLAILYCVHDVRCTAEGTEVVNK